MILTKLLRNRIVSNAGWLVGGRIAQMLISLVVSLLTARYLGPSNYGLINYATAYTAFFASLCTLGINSVLVKEFIDDPEQEGTIIGTAIVLRMASSLLSALAIIGVVSVIDEGEPTTILVVSLSTLGMIFQVFEVFHYWFQSRLESKITAIVSFAAYFIMAVYRVVMIILGKSVAWFALAMSIDYISIAVLLFLFYVKHQGKALRFSWKYGKSLLRRSSPFILSGLMVSIYGQTDKLMLKQMISSTEIAFYATASTVCTMWCFVLHAIIDSLSPSVMQSRHRSLEEFERINRILYAIVFYLSLFVSVLMCVLAVPIVRILYGDAYLPAVKPLRIVTWYTAFSYLGVARNLWMVSQDKQKYSVWIYIFAALSNIVLNVFFIPAWGASGAALASLLTQMITVFVVPMLIKPLRRNSVIMLQAIAFQGMKKKEATPFELDSGNGDQQA